MSFGVFFCQAQQLLDDPPACHTLYLTVPLVEPTVARLSSRMPERGLVVLYEQASPKSTAPIHAAIKPFGSKKLVLGPFKAGQVPELDVALHNVFPEGSLVELRKQIKEGSRYRIVLILENYGTKTVGVVVRQKG